MLFNKNLLLTVLATFCCIFILFTFSYYYETDKALCIESAHIMAMHTHSFP